jgi:hypothetical protein
MNTKGRTDMNTDTTSLIKNAFTLVEGWTTRRITRTQWHKADSLIQSAALKDASPDVMKAWEQLASQYEAYLSHYSGKRKAA